MKSNLTLSDAISILGDIINENHIDVTKGLTEPLFRFASSLLPLVNVDLILLNNLGDILFTWRDDDIYGQGWHLSGGCLRIQENVSQRIALTARGEMGINELNNQIPLALFEEIRTSDNLKANLDNQLVRSHHISLLYICDAKTYSLLYNTKIESSTIKWFPKLHDGFIREQKELYGGLLGHYFSRNRRTCNFEDRYIILKEYLKNSKDGSIIMG